MDDFSITRWGKPLSKYQYSIDLKKKVFTSESDYLVLDFTDLDDWTFRTGNSCIFTAYDSCTFRTGKNCIFNTVRGCTFDTGSSCTFHTGTASTFNTGRGCTFSLWDINTCKFKSYDGISIILDRKDNEAYQLNKEFIQLQKIKNG